MKFGLEINEFDWPGGSAEIEPFVRDSIAEPQRLPAEPNSHAWPT